ncbi:MAG: hypothetical protein U0414_18210 [Polyangiaceae bacterium]
MSHVEGCPDLGPACASPSPPAPYWHYVDELIAETALGARLAVTNAFAIETRWALRVVDVNPTYAELDGTPKIVPGEIHHHDETLVDVTDPWFVAVFSAATSGFVSTARLGLSLPIGRTEDDPYALGAQGKSHEHIQAGTGTVLPILGFDLAYTFARRSVVPITLGVGGTALFSLYANEKGYRAPTRFDVGLPISASFLEGRLTPTIALRLAHDGEEYWHGEVGGEGTMVRTELFLGGSLAWRFVDRWWLAGAATGRIASFTDAPTFESVGTFTLSLGTTFDLWDTDEERRARGETVDDGTRIRRTPRDGGVEFEKD